MAKFNPVAVVEVAKVCVARVLPLRDVILPVLPASTPQEKVPLDQRSLSVEAPQEESAAP